MVTIYTTETCPKCKILKKKMEEKGIEFKECTDINVMSALNIHSVPYLEVDNQLMDFGEANNWINNQEG